MQVPGLAMRLTFHLIFEPIRKLFFYPYPWLQDEMSDFVFENIHANVSIEHIRILYRMLLEKTHLANDDRHIDGNMTLTVNEVKNMLTRHNIHDPKYEDREELLAKCHNLWLDTNSS